MSPCRAGVPRASRGGWAGSRRLSAADAYTLPGQLPPPPADAIRRTIDLRHDIDRGPVLIVDRNGRTIRVVRPPS